MSDPLREAAILAMTVVKNEANADDFGSLSQWTVEQGADRFLEVMRSRGFLAAPSGPPVGIVSDESDQHDIGPLPPQPPPTAEQWAEWRRRGIADV